MIIAVMGLFDLDDDNKRKGLTKKQKDDRFYRLKGKCEVCHSVLMNKGVKPKFHHKDGNRSNNKPSNIIMVCPDCHDRLHGMSKTGRKRKRPIDPKELDTRYKKVKKRVKIKGGLLTDDKYVTKYSYVKKSVAKKKVSKKKKRPVKSKGHNIISDMFGI